MTERKQPSGECWTPTGLILSDSPWERTYKAGGGCEAGCAESLLMRAAAYQIRVTGRWVSDKRGILRELSDTWHEKREGGAWALSNLGKQKNYVKHKTRHAACFCMVRSMRIEEAIACGTRGMEALRHTCAARVVSRANRGMEKVSQKCRVAPQRAGDLDWDLRLMKMYSIQRYAVGVVGHNMQSFAAAVGNRTKRERHTSKLPRRSET
jgi:hypothetical protein